MVSYFSVCKGFVAILYSFWLGDFPQRSLDQFLDNCKGLKVQIQHLDEKTMLQGVACLHVDKGGPLKGDTSDRESMVKGDHKK